MSLTRTVGAAVGDDSRGDCSTTGGIGAVADTVTKVDVFAEAISCSLFAAKGWSKGEHVVDACLLEKEGLANASMMCWDRQKTSLYRKPPLDE